MTHDGTYKRAASLARETLQSLPHRSPSRGLPGPRLSSQTPAHIVSQVCRAQLICLQESFTASAEGDPEAA